MIKKWDIILIVLMVIISFIPEVIFLAKGNKKYESSYVEISVDGKIDRKIPLIGGEKEQIIEIKGKEGINIIKILDNHVEVINADCNDKVCINFGQIRKNGESIVCLPNRVVVSIKGQAEDDNIILSY